MPPMTYEEKTLDLQIYQLGVTVALTVAAYLYVYGKLDPYTPHAVGIIAIIGGGVVGAMVILSCHKKYLSKNTP